MARKKRIEFPGARFHIWIRRVDRSQLFLDHEDWASYVALLGETVARFGWTVIEFCLMPNHVHLLIELSEPNLGDGMQHLHANYVRRYSRRHDRTGRLFERRFQWKAVTDELYFLTVRQYIGENPVRAMLCARPEEWLWSSRGLVSKLG